MSRKITILLSFLLFGLVFQSKGQAPITGSTDLCATTSTTLSSTDLGGTWTSSNTTIATININGTVVYGAGSPTSGTSVITYSSSAGVVTTTVTVGVFPGATTGPLRVCQGTSVTLSNTTTGGSWSSNYPLAASVDPVTGVVTGGNPTAAPASTVTITYATNCGDALFVIIVDPAMTPISGAGTDVCQQSTLILSDATPGGTWSSSNVAIASVVGGVVTGGTVGAAVINYTNVCGTATYNVNVLQKPSPVTGVNSFCSGSTATLGSTPTGGTWSSSNTTSIIIDINTGVVTTGPPGSGLVTYTLTNGCYSTYGLVVNNCPACPINSDFELGNYSVWKYYTGTCCPINTGAVCAIPAGGPPPCGTNRFALTGLAPGGSVVITGTDPFGGFPVVGAGAYSLRIGTCETNYYAEKARYFVHVPIGPGAYSLIYRYAIVMQDPNHSAATQPRFTVQAFDVTTAADTNTGGTIVPCADFNYVAGALPGFVQTTITGGPRCGPGGSFGPHSNPGLTSVFSKDWATTSINLTGLGGHTIRMDFAAGDCGQSGHFGYGYVDMTCGTFAISSLGCGDSVATVTAPSGFANYEWRDSVTWELMGTTQTVTFPMPTTPTTYAVIMSPFLNFGCPDTLYTRIMPSNLQLHPNPDTLICAGQSVTISSNATDIALPLEYQWTPVTGLSCGTCASPVATPFAGVNVYTVSVTDAAGCSKSTTQTVTVDSVAMNIFNTPVTCYGRTDGTATVTPTSGSGPFTYSWSTVPAQTSSVATGLPVGNYTATAIDSKGCSGTAITTITQPPILTMSIGGSTDPTKCDTFDGTITITGLVPDSVFTIQYFYSATGATTTVTTVRTFTATPTGVVLMDSLENGIYDSIRIITAKCPYNTLGPITLADPLPPAPPYVTSNSPVCIGQALNLTTTSTSSDATFQWSGPGGFTNTTQTPVKNPSAFSDSGWYIVSILVKNCPAKDSTKVVIRDTTHPVTTSNSQQCAGDTLKFTSFNNVPGSPADFYSWNGPNGFISNFQNPIILNATTAASGLYTVTITYQGCVGMGTASMTVIATPDPPTVTDTNYCQFSFDPPGYAAPQLTATGTDLKWYTVPVGGTPMAAAPTPSTSVVGIKTWYVDQTSATTPACTSARSSVTVGVYALPEPKFTISDSVFCQGTYFTFEARDVNTGVDYQGLTWSFTPADGSTPDIVNDVNPVIHSFGVPGLIEVAVAVNYRVCADTVMRHNVRVFPFPGIYLGQDTAICPGGTALTLTAANDNTIGATWLWSTGETTSSINVVAPGTYYVRGTMSGCSTSDTIIVANDCYMNLPNVFTPNGDGVNDYFYPRQYLTRGLTSFSMNIYNRWGQVVFTSTSIEGRGWDGKFNDVPQPQGVFVYVIDATFKDGQKEHHQGNVTLMR